MKNVPQKLETIETPEGLAIIFTPETLEHLGAKLGDTLIVEETAHGVTVLKKEKP